VFSSHDTIDVLSFTETVNEVGHELSGLEILEYGVVRKDSSVPNHLMRPFAMTTIISAAEIAWEKGKERYICYLSILLYHDNKGNAYFMHTA
jgi:hypothetical protein